MQQDLILYQGVRQDHLGRDYVDSNRGPQYLDPPQHNFKMKFFGDFKGHRWHFKSGDKPRVEMCTQVSRCSVCGPTHLPIHVPVEVL